MDLGCSICQEAFSASSICVATKCGHVFHKSCQYEWMKNSKTCPSCRAACPQSALIRVFFNTSLSDPSQADTESLRAKLDAVEERLTSATKQNKTLEGELRNYKEKQLSLKTMVSTLDELYKRSNHHAKTLMAQLKDYDAQKAKADALSTKVAELSSHIEQMRQIDRMLGSSAQEIESLITPETTGKTLAFLVVTLKRELAECESKKSQIFSTNCKLNHMVKQKGLEIECMQEKFSALQSDFLAIQSQLGKDQKETPPAAATPNQQAVQPTTTSPQPVSQSSPYLRLAQSVVGLTPLLRKPQEDTHRPLRDNLQKLSIFQSSRVTKSARLDIPHQSFDFKENHQDALSHAQKSDRFKIDARLKSGAIKRPGPYPTK